MHQNAACAEFVLTSTKNLHLFTITKRPCVSQAGACVLSQTQSTAYCPTFHPIHVEGVTAVGKRVYLMCLVENTMLLMYYTRHIHVALLAGSADISADSRG